MSPSSGSVAVMGAPTPVPAGLFSATASVVTVLASKDGAWLVGSDCCGPPPPTAWPSGSTTSSRSVFSRKASAESRLPSPSCTT